ncbi:hypothetical protein [Methylobacterium sp.]|uniref:hypothetical protein n=1 Tax=Methylobacterium sp. TaxID=409 RepID=UPI0025EA3296|nr:hypothetical protein [Methylobacterium sp.]MBY0256924.1 hypothetical protein [Methylobacterium sp.]
MSSPTRVIEADLGTILGAIAASRIGGGKSSAPKRTTAQDIETLKAAAVRYLGPTVFKVGDLITPRADSPITQVGAPHIVLEVREDFPIRPMEATDPKHVDLERFGAKLDIRVASVCGFEHGEVRPFWEESWMFDPYVAPVDAETPSEAA